MTAPLLVLAVGNPSRGDDALGPLFLERLTDLLAPELAARSIELLTDFQLQPEHALDVAPRREVVFVDASLKAEPPFTFTPAAAAADPSISSHALSPGAVLEVLARIAPDARPKAWILALRGESFELGEPLGAAARAHLEAALAFFVAHVRSDDARRLTPLSGNTSQSPAPPREL